MVEEEEGWGIGQETQCSSNAVPAGLGFRASSGAALWLPLSNSTVPWLLLEGSGGVSGKDQR